MRRASLERPRTLRVWRAHKRLIHDDLATGCICDEQPGRFRKGQRVGGCGRPRCLICKGHKLNNELTYRDYRAAWAYHELGVEFGFAVRMPRKPYW